MTGYVREFYFHAVKLTLPSFPDGLSFSDNIHRTLRQSRHRPRVDCSSNPRSFPGAAYRQYYRNRRWFHTRDRSFPPGKLNKGQRHGLYTFPFRIKRGQVSVIASRT